MQPDRLIGGIHGTASGYPESLWDLHPWEYSNLFGHGHGHPALAEPEG